MNNCEQLSPVGFLAIDVTPAKVDRFSESGTIKAMRNGVPHSTDCVGHAVNDDGLESTVSRAA